MGKNTFYIILMGLLFNLTGCNTSDEFNNIEKSIRDRIYPARLNNNFKFGIGALSTTMIGGFTRDEHEADTYMKEIKGVQVGMYEVDNSRKSADFHIPDNIGKCLVEKGWEPFVHVRKRHGENVSLFYRQVSENEASIYTIVLEHNELVIVEINGNLNTILEKAICEHRLAGIENI